VTIPILPIAEGRLIQNVSGEGERIFVGPYEVIEELGCGGMAQVLLCIRRFPGGQKKACVVKIPTEATLANRRLRQQFEKECALAMFFVHDNLIEAWDCGVHNGVPYLAMMFVSGANLAEFLAKEADAGQLPSVEAASYITSAVGRGMAYAHDLDPEGRPAGFVHRDLKAENVLLSHEGGVRVGDFGVATITDYLSGGDVVKGTTRTMAPEQIGGLVAQCNDFWAVGVILFECLTCTSFRGDVSVHERSQAALKGYIPPMTRPGVPAPILEAVYGWLERDHGRRLSIIDGLALIAAFATGRPEVAKKMKVYYGRARTGRTIDYEPRPFSRLRRTLAIGGILATSEDATSVPLSPEPEPEPEPEPDPEPSREPDAMVPRAFQATEPVHHPGFTPFPFMGARDEAIAAFHSFSTSEVAGMPIDLLIDMHIGAGDEDAPHPSAVREIAAKPEAAMTPEVAIMPEAAAIDDVAAILMAGVTPEAAVRVNRSAADRDVAVPPEVAALMLEALTDSGGTGVEVGPTLLPTERLVPGASPWVPMPSPVWSDPVFVAPSERPVLSSPPGPIARAPADVVSTSAPSSSIASGSSPSSSFPSSPWVTASSSIVQPWPSREGPRKPSAVRRNQQSRLVALMVSMGLLGVGATWLWAVTRGIAEDPDRGPTQVVPSPTVQVVAATVEPESIPKDESFIQLMPVDGSSVEASVATASLPVLPSAPPAIPSAAEVESGVPSAHASAAPPPAARRKASRPSAAGEATSKARGPLAVRLDAMVAEVRIDRGKPVEMSFHGTHTLERELSVGTHIVESRVPGEKEWHQVKISIEQDSVTVVYVKTKGPMPAREKLPQ